MSERYSVEIFWSLDDGGFIATVPDLPGCSAFGITRKRAAAEIDHAIAAYLEARQNADAQALFEKDGNTLALWHAEDEATRLFYRLEATRQCRAPALPDQHQSTDQAHVAAPLPGS